MWNKYQSNEEELNIENLPDEVREEFYECLNIPFIKWLISPDRPRACDLPRDEKGRIIVDVTKPHILEDMDYFRPTAIHYQRTGKLTDLKPNGNPNSEFGKWILEEVRRCRDGYVRESDGEWVTGDMYFFLNYYPIEQTKTTVGSRKGDRIVDFPEVWDGIYLRYHYMDQARNGGMFDCSGGLNGAEISSRGKSKSLTMASKMTKYFTLGESSEVNKRVKVVATAYTKEYLNGNDGILTKFQNGLDFIATDTQFPHLLLKNSLQDMTWQMGWKDLDTGARMGTLNQASGVAIKDDISKIRGKRQNFIVCEEFGSFAGITQLYNIMLPCVREGNYSFGQIYLVGTAGDKQSDFQQATELIYNPKGYYLYALPNVYDKPGDGRKFITFFYPEYLNRKGLYDENGNSDVTAALVEILLDRYRVKYNTTDLATITKNIAERPITPQEAIMRAKGNKFPVNDLNQRLNELDNNPHEFDDVFVGELVETASGEVEFKPTDATPIRIYPIEDNMTNGALEIFCMPQKDSNGKVPSGRYICSDDPIDQDRTTDSTSLYSTFVLDLFTDNVVAEYTGRMEYAEQNYEVTRLLCKFYNCKTLYEAHPISQKIITPDGERTWVDIGVGDKLFDENGSTTTVRAILNRCVAPIYKVTLGDGREIRCSEDHIWSVYRMTHHPHELKDYSTKELLKIGVINKHKQHSFFLPTAKCVDYKHQNVPIDPYTLGLLISEGALTKFKKTVISKKKRRSVQISASIDDGKFYSGIIPYEMKYIGKTGFCWHIYIDDVRNKLDSLGLLHKRSEDKFIPDLYLNNDEETRLELLKGLMDGDGCAVKSGACVYITASEKLKDSIMLLCRSLGINCKNKLQDNYEIVSPTNGKTYKTKRTYRITIYSKEKIFKLPRKIEKQHVYKPDARGSKADAYLNKNVITNIEFCGYEESFCVSVDNPTGRYLIGDYVVTHNCNIKGQFAYFSKLGCLNMLADTPEYLQDKELLRIGTIGNTMKGVRATKPINNYADDLTKEWLIQPETVIIKNEEGKEVEVTRKKLFSLRNRALIMELIKYNSFENFDRIRAFGMLMLYREQFRIAAGGDIQEQKEIDWSETLNFDPFFTRIFNRGRQ